MPANVPANCVCNGIPHGIKATTTPHHQAETSKARFTQDIELLVSTRGQTQWVVSVRSIGNHYWSLHTHSIVIVTHYVEI